MMEIKDQGKEAWIQKIQDKLEHYTEPLPADGWEQVQQKMARSVGMRIWRRWAVAAALIGASVAGVSYLFLQTDTADHIRTLAFLPNPEEWSLPKQVVASPVDQTATVAVSVLPKPVQSTQPARQPDVHVNTEVRSLTIDEQVVDSPVETVIDSVAPVVQPVPTMPTQRSADYRHYTQASYPRKKAGFAPSKGRGWSLGLMVRSGMHNSNLGPQGDMFYADMPQSSNALPSFSPDDGLAMIAPGQDFLIENGEVVINGQHSNIPKSIHQQPISFGVSVRKSLDKNWAVESGLVYTYLSSEIGISGGYAEQRLHYLGLPLKLVYDFGGRSRFRFYVSGGGMLERCMQAQSESSTLKLPGNQLDFSLLGSVGAQYNLTPHVGLYAEPGISYYTMTADIESIRSERPLNLTLQAGIRFSY